MCGGAGRLGGDRRRRPSPATARRPRRRRRRWPRPAPGSPATSSTGRSSRRGPARFRPGPGRAATRRASSGARCTPPSSACTGRPRRRSPSAWSPRPRSPDRSGPQAAPAGPQQVSHAQPSSTRSRYRTQPAVLSMSSRHRMGSRLSTSCLGVASAVRLSTAAGVAQPVVSAMSRTVPHVAGAGRSRSPDRRGSRSSMQQTVPHGQVLSAQSGAHEPLGSRRPLVVSRHSGIRPVSRVARSPGRSRSSRFSPARSQVVGMSPARSEVVGRQSAAQHAGDWRIPSSSRYRPEPSGMPPLPAGPPVLQGSMRCRRHRCSHQSVVATADGARPPVGGAPGHRAATPRQQQRGRAPPIRVAAARRAVRAAPAVGQHVGIGSALLAPAGRLVPAVAGGCPISMVQRTPISSVPSQHGSPGADVCRVRTCRGRDAAAGRRRPVDAVAGQHAGRASRPPIRIGVAMPIAAACRRPGAASGPAVL